MRAGTYFVIERVIVKITKIGTVEIITIIVLKN